MKNKVSQWMVLWILLFAGCSKELYTDNGTFTDSRDNHAYKWVQIGGQVWMAENLAYLPAVSLLSSASKTEPLYYVGDYNDSIVDVAKATQNYQTYGALYNWVAAMTACPKGWHLPADLEWTTLTDFLGEEPGRKMKSKTKWYSHLLTYGNGNNSSGFNALPGGYRAEAGWSFGGFGGDIPFGRVANFWSSSENRAPAMDEWAVQFELSWDAREAYQFGQYRQSGLSVRCVKDDH